MNVAELIMEYIVEENHSPGSGYNFLSVNNNDAIGVSSGSGSTISMNHFKSDRLDTNDLHGLDSEIFLEGSSDDLDLDFTENAENTNIVNNRNSNNNNADDDKNSYSSLTNQPFIQVKLIHFMRQSNSSKIIPQSSANNLINLDVPSLLMQPNNMHIFVQFEMLYDSETRDQTAQKSQLLSTSNTASPTSNVILMFLFIPVKVFSFCEVSSKLVTSELNEFSIVG
ncbi:unnamed protein product [Trichobilharzia regenti]|nr:unnamed protein product [Trichobilharzia regenti]